MAAYMERKLIFLLAALLFGFALKLQAQGATATEPKSGYVTEKTALAASNDEGTALVSGYVTDAETGERLSDVFVRISTITTVTNAYGYYSLRAPLGIHQITAIQKT